MNRGITDNNICVVISDWRSVEEDEPPKKKKKNLNIEETIYKNLLSSAIENFKLLGIAPEVNEGFQNLPEGGDTRAIIERIQKLMTVIKSHKCKGMQYTCKLGLELAKYKHINFTTPCTKHNVGKHDMYAILECKYCIKENDCKRITQVMIDTTGYSKSHINFLIAISKLCENYPKFKYNNFTIATN